MNKKRKNFKKGGLKEWGLALLLALILALFIKGFIFQSFKVVSPKMEKTILMNDYVIVNKLNFGARLPVCLLSVPFFPEIYSDLITLPSLRLPGFNNIKLNDILVFNYPAQHDPPIDKRDVLIKRCVGLPGDTIKINNKIVTVNGRVFENSDNVQFNYRLVTNGQKLSNDFLDKFDINEGGLVSDIGIYDFPLTNKRLEQIKAEENIRYVRELKDFPGENTQYIFPIGYYYSYNKDNFGPVIVPYKGQVIQINNRNIELYQTLIADYEGNTLEVKNHDILINGEIAQEYTIKENYYFVLDDNRDNAKDSRYWGFLPENHIIGTAKTIWFSFDKTKNKIRWKRMFKSI